jgi:hypothetical protein
MNIQKRRSRTPGQSIPLIALIIVVLFAMVGLSVDVGNTYAQQREATRAANAAALNGMNVIIRNGSETSDGAVTSAIKESLRSNGIVLTEEGGDRNLRAFYLDKEGKPFACRIGSCGTVPKGTTYLQVELEGATDTYFARVVGRDTLPVNAQAFATQCAPTDNVFPISVNASYLDDKGFVEPNGWNAADDPDHYGLYGDENYKDKWQRRVFVKDAADVPGGFSYLRWLGESNNGSAVNLENMLQGQGNLAAGFEEADWPDGAPGKPDGYPSEPGQLTSGDWIHGNSGFSYSNAVRAALDEHIEKRTVMLLPIIEEDRWLTGNNAVFKLNRLGGFLLRDYGKEQGKPYLDLVYVGDANSVPCTLTNVPTALDEINVTGSVFVRPRHETFPDADQPIDFVVLLDVSGSMSLNFRGESNHRGRGKTVLCSKPKDYDPETDPEIQNCGRNFWYKDEDQRRIYYAKQALMTFVDEMEEDDAMQIIAYSSRYGVNNIEPVNTRALGTTAGKAELRETILEAGERKVNGSMEPYITRGGTPSATGLRKARELLAAAPETAPNGDDYKRVVVFLTDGVANHFVEEVDVYGESDVWKNEALDEDRCADLGSEAQEDVGCQSGYVLTNPSVARPITAMTLEADELKTSADATLYAMMMGAAPTTGVEQVASSSQYPWYSVAEEGADVEEILLKINETSRQDVCIPAEGTWMDVIDSANAPSPVDGHPYLGADTFGKAVLTDPVSGEELYEGYIRHDEATGKLSYFIPGVEPGTYELRVWLGYEGEDGNTRIYRKFYDYRGDLSYSSTLTVQVTQADALNDTVVAPEAYMELDGHVCPDPE